MHGQAQHTGSQGTRGTQLLGDYAGEGDQRTAAAWTSADIQQGHPPGSKDAKGQQDTGEGLCRDKSLVTRIGNGGYEQQAVFIGEPHGDL